MNPNVQVDLYDTLFTSENAREIVEPYDIVIDGTDNFPTRYLSNDICVFLKKPNIYGSIFRFDGQCTVFAPHLGGPCYRCMFPEPPPPGMVPSCAEGGVLGVLPGIIGVMQAIEAIKLIIGIGEPLIGRLVHFDALKMKFREFKLRQGSEVPGLRPEPDDHRADRLRPILRHPAGAKRRRKRKRTCRTSPCEELKAKLDRGDKFVLIDVREPYEWDICRIPGARLIPLGQLPSRMSELDSADEIVLQCKSGVAQRARAEAAAGSGLRQALRTSKAASPRGRRRSTRACRNTEAFGASSEASATHWPGTGQDRQRALCRHCPARGRAARYALQFRRTGGIRAADDFRLRSVTGDRLPQA